MRCQSPPTTPESCVLPESRVSGSRKRGCKKVRQDRSKVVMENKKLKLEVQKFKRKIL